MINTILNQIFYDINKFDVDPTLFEEYMLSKDYIKTIKPMVKINDYAIEEDDEKITENIPEIKERHELFMPRVNDRLFCCIYIVNVGIGEYHMLGSRYKNVELQEKQNIVDDYIQKWNVKYNSKNNAASLEYANLIRNYHKYLTKSTSLPAPRKDAPPELVSDDIFLIIRYPSFEGNFRSNDMGTQVYSAKAYFSYNIEFNTYEIYNISINDDFEYEKNFFKKNHEWEYEDRITKLNKEFGCPKSSYFTNPMLISTDGKVVGEYQSLYLKEDCINAVGQTYTTYPIELYFIKDLEKFIKK